MVEDGAFCHKVGYVFKFFLDILNPAGHLNHITGSKVTAIFVEWVDFSYWWIFSGEGSASAACATGLFLTLP